MFDESLRLLRTALRDDDVTFAGDYFTVRGVRVLPKPDTAAGYLDRRRNTCGVPAHRRLRRRLAGQLPDSHRGGAGTDATSIAAADEAGRDIEPDHYGISLAVGNGELPAPVLAAIRRRRPDLDPSELVATDWPTLHRRLDDYIAAGLTKFVIRPAGNIDIADFLEAFVSRTAAAAELSELPAGRLDVHTDRCSTCLQSRGACTPASSRAGAGLPPAPPGSGECGALGSSPAWHPRPSR